MPDDLRPAYLIAGSDRPKITRALRRLRGRFDEETVEVVSAAETPGEAAVAACNALGLFGGGRLVVVEDVERWRAADVEAVAAYTKDPAPGAVLALVAGELKKDAPLAKAVSKVGEVLIYDVTKRELPKWVAEQFARVGATAEPAAARALVELVGENLDELTGEVEKLATWAAGAEIRQADVELLAAGRAETSIFSLTDAWGRRDVGAALAAAEALLERGTGQRRDELPRIVGLLYAHVARVAECQSLAAAGVGAREAASRLKRSPYYVEKLYAQAANFGVEELRGAVLRIAELDLALKGASRLTGELELGRALVDLARPREPQAV